jgi:hypothetical protein
MTGETCSICRKPIEVTADSWRKIDGVTKALCSDCIEEVDNAGHA